MSKPPAFQFYAQDFLTGVMYLTNEEKGIYITMLAKQWTDGRIPKKRLGFLVGYDWENLSQELKDKFEDCGAYIVNKRLEEEREKKSRFLEKQKLNGKLGGRPKKKTRPKNPKQTQKKPLEEEDEIEVEKEIEKAEEGETEIYPTFDDFWELYDKKTGKEKSVQKWNKLKQAEKELIINHIPLYRKSQPNKKYRKNPETYLNNKAWEDEIIIENHGQKSNREIFDEAMGSETAKNLKFS